MKGRRKRGRMEGKGRQRRVLMVRHEIVNDEEVGPIEENDKRKKRLSHSILSLLFPIDFQCAVQ